MATTTRTSIQRSIVATAALITVPMQALAQTAVTPIPEGRPLATATSPMHLASTDDSANAAELAAARHCVEAARSIAKEMERDPAVQNLLSAAKGIYIVPDFAKGGLAIGGWGGHGVLLVREGERWMGPAFYNLGAVSVGPLIGFSTGAIAMMLMSDDAVTHFRTDDAFSLMGTADFTFMDYSAMKQTRIGKRDVIVWADTQGAYTGLSASISDITWDRERNDRFYGKAVTAKEALTNTLESPGEADALRQALDE